MMYVSKLKRTIKNRIRYLENVIVPQTQYRNPDVMGKLSPTNSRLSMYSSLASLRGSVLKEIDHDTARTAMVTQPRGELSPPDPSDLNQRYVVSTPSICTCHSESKYYVLWPATDGLNKHLNERTYDKLVSICGGSSYVEVFDSRDLGVINWRVRLTMGKAEQVSSWAEV
ncbi:hypothetical protein CCHR01_04969 [Colletotrichum chrysophilum]|uniref:Uncharacterized protein n=1 Tax=Colletotrichum chrysophilum TaxID=1836956 RepID=A0AAD9EL80_9PEZI|nr:hypothetical protein CCHR01_04969 [Colletotrichum chrysophilum]